MYAYQVSALEPGATVELSQADGAFSCEWYAVSRDGEGMPFALESLRSASVTIDFKVTPETQAAVSRLFHFDRSRGNPGRLCVDGHEYARRRKARKKRR